MEESLNRENPVVRLRAFRAIDEPATCELFVEGHTNVLSNIGITKVTSSKNEWVTNPCAFVLIVESIDGKKIYGGARVHVAGGSELLPIEQAAAELDSGVFDLVWKYAQEGTGELCGLWNSREIAGYGIGSIFLIRAAVAVAHQLGLKTLFAFCAPYTVKPVANCGMELEPSIGNNGTFFYPKLDLVATTMLLKDVEVLSKAEPEDKESIITIRENLNGIRIEELRKKEITIHYEVKIPNLENWSLAETIVNAQKNFLNAKVKPYVINFL